MTTEKQVLEQIKAKSQPPAEEAQVEEEQESVAEDATETTQDAEDVSEIKGDEEAEAPTEEEGDFPDFGEYEFTYKADGEDHVVTLDQLMELAPAGHNYSKRQNELRVKEEKVETLQKQLESSAQVQHRLTDTLEYLEESLSNVGYTKAELAELAKTDRDQYIEIMAQRDANLEALEQVRKAKSEVRTQQEALAQQQAINLWQETVRTYPELNSSEGKQPYVDYLKSKGFNDQDVATVLDKRLFGILKDAMAGSQVRDKKRIAAKRVKDVPKVTKRKVKIDQAQKSQAERAQVKQRAQAGDRKAKIEMFRR